MFVLECVCVLHASVFPEESVETAAAVSPYKDVCSWTEGWRKGRRNTLVGGRTGVRRRGVGDVQREDEEGKHKMERKMVGTYEEGWRVEA